MIPTIPRSKFNAILASAVDAALVGDEAQAVLDACADADYIAVGLYRTPDTGTCCPLSRAGLVNLDGYPVDDDAYEAGNRYSEFTCHFDRAMDHYFAAYRNLDATYSTARIAPDPDPED